MIKKWIKISVSLLLSVGLYLSASAAGTQKELVVVSDISGVPFTIQDRDKQILTGFDIELWDEIARRLGVKYRYQLLEFGGIIPGLQTGNVDVAIAGITINDKRKRIIDFSDAYYDAGVGIMTHVKDKARFSNLAALKASKVKIAVKTGTLAAEFLKKQGLGDQLVLLPSSDSMYLSFETGRVAAVAHDVPQIKYFAKVRGKGQWTLSLVLIDDDQYGIAFPKHSPWREPVNKALAEIRADGTYQKIYDRWFGQ